MYNSIKQKMSFGHSGTHEINTGSMADIAFLLLIFFLVTTTINTDIGILRKLPPKTDSEPLKQHKRNVLQVWINGDNNLMVSGETIDISDLRGKIKEFIKNPDKAEDLPEIETMNIQYLGESQVSNKHIISLMSDRNTKYSNYIAVQNEILGAYNELREEVSLKNFNKSFNELDKTRKKSIETVYPIHISEAEPNVQ
jgi:biopolymer transport protein ExbD